MPRAAYLDVADRLAARWAGLPPGTLVDSEHQLADEFGINRLTAREALRELERRLVVRREVGRGTYTAFRLDYRVELGGIASFQRTVASLGHAVQIVAVELAWRDGELQVERVSTVDGFLASVGTDRFPERVAKRVADDVQAGGSIHAALEAAGYAPRRRSVHVSMEVPPADVAERLGFSASAPPTWRLRSTTVDATTSEVVNRSDGWLRADMFDVSVHLSE